MADIKPPRVVIPQAAECVQVYPDSGATADIPGESSGGAAIRGSLVRAIPSAQGLVFPADVQAAIKRLVMTRADYTRQMGMLGNSLFANNPNPPTTASGYSDGEFQIVVNAGVSGNKTADMLARVATDIPDGLDGCFVEECTNDGSTGVSVSAHVANMKGILDNLTGRAIPPTIILPPPNSAGNAAAIEVLRTHDWLIAQEYSIRVRDPWHGVRQSDGTYIATMTSDNVHLSTLGNLTASIDLARQERIDDRAMLYPVRNLTTGSATDGYFSNCLFVNSGTPTAGVPNGWSKIGTGAVSVGTDAAVLGQYCQIAISAGTSTLIYREITSGFSVGDEIIATAQLLASGLSTAVARAYVRFVGGTTGGDLSIQFETSDTALQRDLVVGVIPPGTTKMQVYLEVAQFGPGVTTGTGTAQFSEVQVWNKTALKALW